MTEPRTRRISNTWTTTFSVPQSKLLQLNVSMDRAGTAGDWQRFFQERDLFIESCDGFDEGWVEVWVAMEQDIFAPPVQGRHLFYRFLERSAGALSAWVVESPQEHPVLKTCCSMPEAPICPFEAYWLKEGSQKIGRQLAKDHAERVSESICFEGVQGSLWLDEREKKHFKVFGFLNVKNFKDFCGLLHLKSGKLDVTQVNFEESKSCLNWEERLPELTQRFDIIDRRQDITIKTEQRARPSSQVCDLLHQDVESLKAQVQSMEVKVRKEQRRSEEAMEMKAEFLSVINHELRTPLNGMISMVDLLMTTELNDEQMKYTKMASASSAKLLAQITRLLDFAKLDSGRMELKEVPFSLDTLIHNGLNKHRQQANEKGLKFELQLPDAKEEVLGDPDRLQQMIHELVENSLEFTKEGKVSVSVMVNEPSSSELKIRVEVKDTGCGIEQSKADVIFQQFSQVDMSNTRKFSGIGLGLSLCRKLAILMGGKIGVQSEEGKGSRFWFDVMLKKVEIENQIHCQDNGVDLSERFSKMIALVVDDNAISRRVMVKALSAFGFEVEVTGSGYAALELLKTQDYNLAILDLSMHDLNGIEIANLLREGDGQLPILFGIARKSDATTLERCLDAGMKGLIKKPLDPKKLKRLLVQVLI